MRGGSIIGEGGQACILRPAVQTNLKNSSKYVSKIALKSDIIVESTVGLKLSKIDPKGIYGIYPSSKMDCNIDAPLLLLNEGIQPSKQSKSKCSQIAASKCGEYCALTFKSFDYDLETQMPDLSSKEMLACLLHLWKGLVMMHANNIVHGDIKTSNIAFRSDRKGPLRFAFTDWGWSGYIYKTQVAKCLLQEMTRHPSYRPTEFGGNKGIWAPILWNCSNDYSEQDLLKFNDVFSMSYMQMDIIKEMKRKKQIPISSFKILYQALKDIVYNEEKYIALGTASIVKSLAKLYKL